MAVEEEAAATKHVAAHHHHPPPPQRSPDAGDGGRSRRGASKSIFDVPRARGPPSSSPAPFVIVSRRSRFRLLLFDFRPQTKSLPAIIAVRFPFLMLNNTHKSCLRYRQALQTLREASMPPSTNRVLRIYGMIRGEEDTVRFVVFFSCQTLLTSIFFLYYYCRSYFRPG